MRLCCAQRSDVISTRQKIGPKTVYYFKILVVYELALSLHQSNFIFGGFLTDTNGDLTT